MTNVETKMNEVLMEPEDFSGIIFIFELKGHVGHRQRIFPLHFVNCRLQSLTGKKLKVLTGAQTLINPSFVAREVIQLVRLTTFSCLVTNLNQMALTDLSAKEQLNELLRKLSMSKFREQ